MKGASINWFWSLALRAARARGKTCRITGCLGLISELGFSVYLRAAVIKSVSAMVGSLLKQRTPAWHRVVTVMQERLPRAKPKTYCCRVHLLDESTRPSSVKYLALTLAGFARNYMAGGGRAHHDDQAERLKPMDRTALKVILVPLVTVLVITASGSAFSQVYVGASYGVSVPYDADEDDARPEFEDDSAFRVFVGNRLSRKFAVEVAYTNFGEYEVQDPESIGFVENTLAITGVDASVMGKLPLGKRLALYGRLGFFYWDAERMTMDDVGTVNLVTADELDYVIGAGIEYRALNHFGITLDANSFSTDDIFNLVYGLGVYYNF